MNDRTEDELHHEVVVAAEDKGLRLDVLLARVLQEFSRNRIKELILGGAVAIDGQKSTIASRKLKPGERIELAAPPLVDATPLPEDIGLDILFEDDDLIVINKPAGLVVHPAPGSPAGTLVNALIHHCGPSLQGIGGVRRPGIVHRLDKLTSGVMVAAKNEAALRGLASQFADHGRSGPLVRSYLALVWGALDSKRGTIDAPLGRDAHSRLKQAVRKDGREAITHYHVAALYSDDGWAISQVTCRLETGRTHQIRVHMTHIGHPVIGDPVYASGFQTKANILPEGPADRIRLLGRQALHASELGFAHPVNGKEMLFSAPPPPDLAQIIGLLAPYRQNGT